MSEDSPPPPLTSSFTSEELEKNVLTLKNMGIEDDDHIRMVLRQTSNDVEEALQLLIPDDNNLSNFTARSSSFERISSYEADMEVQEAIISNNNDQDSDQDSTTVSYSLEENRLNDLVDDRMGGDSPPKSPPTYQEDPPPSYEEEEEEELVSTSLQEPVMMDEREDGEEVEEGVVTEILGEDEMPLSDDKPQQEATPSDTPTTNDPTTSIEFPLTHYYELEGRTHTDQWSIPYKREESLAVCMLATIKMMKEGPGVAEADENCVKFLERTLPSCFDKLLVHEAVFRWDESIMKGIREMSQILVELIAVRLSYKPVPIYLLNLLSIAINADTSFHQRNRLRRIATSNWINELGGEDRLFAVSPHITTRKDPKGWLVEFMNIFTLHRGVVHIRDLILNNDSLTLQELTALFQPFSGCDEYIAPLFFKNEMSECLQYAIQYINDLKDESLKDKEVGCVFDLLKTLKTLLRRCSLIDYANVIDSLRLSTTLRMFQIPHFNAKMNALKEVVRLTEEPYSAARAGIKNPILADRVRSWLIDNKVLSIAFGGNLHQAQYCDKVKSIVEFLGSHLSTDELNTIWGMQVDKNPAQVENIHNILAYAVSGLSPQHMDLLFQLIQQSWETASSDRYREKLIGLIGKIGKDDRTGKTASKILELLWGLAHLHQLSREMIELALNSHYSILIDSFHTKDGDKKHYIVKCVEDIKKCQWVVSAINHLHRLAKGMFRSSYGHKDQQQISDLQKQHDLLRTISGTLTKVHAKTVAACNERGEKLSGATLIDGRYTQEECVDAHLQLLHFLLQDGSLYLPMKRAYEVWDALIANPDACSTDRKLAFKWFDHSMGDLETETQHNLFHKRVLRVEPSLLDMAGYHCIKSFFESVNIAERKLRKLQHSHQLIIDNPDLIGIDYLWKAALEVKEESIADELISNLLQITYNALTPKIKKDPEILHRRFIDECFTRLNSLVEPPEDLDPNLRVQCVERLLLLAQRYLTMVEESHPYPRQIPAHGASFPGQPIKLYISVDQHQTNFMLPCHTNESLVSVRKKIAEKLKVTPEQVQIGTSDKWLIHYNKLIHQLNLTEEHHMIVKTNMGMSYSTAVGIDSSERLKIALKQERILPGVIMASHDRDTFTKLEQLCSTGEPRIIAAVRTLLSLIPVNQRILEALEIFVHPISSQGASEDSLRSFPSPQEVLKEFYDSSSVSPTQLLYNLEVLSGKLMPVNQLSDNSCQTFRRHFLEANGLKCVLNILQSSSFPSEMDIEIRQGCYAITLSLAKFLLCATPIEPIQTNEEVGGDDVGEEPHPPPMLRGTSRTISVEDEVARMTIETMSQDDFRTILSCLMSVSWASAAGKLHLHQVGGGVSQLKAGVCSLATTVSSKDACIAQESLELLITCLRLRKNLLSTFYTLPNVKEFLVDVLLGSTHPSLRSSLVEYLYELCQETSPFSITNSLEEEEEGEDQTCRPKRPCPSSQETPQHFLLHLLLYSPSCELLWKRSSTDLGDLIIWGRSREYFNFLYKLLHKLSSSEQLALSVDIPTMLDKELKWLSTVTVPSSPCPEVQTLLAGHLQLMCALVSCTGIDKKQFTNSLVCDLLNIFLFPASSLSLGSRDPEFKGILNIEPKCNEVLARVAAYDLLIELSKGCLENMTFLSKKLIDMHHRTRPQNSKDWEFRPLTIGRSLCGYVGLKNAGATCYMNTVLQQLYMQPGIRDALLSIEKDEEESGSILHEIQCIFGHLLESNLQYYTPDNFWKNFRLEGQPVNVLEHQDASEFFSSLTDQIDELLKKKGTEKVFGERFGGQFLDQIICHGCEHRFEKEQGFTSLQLSVVQSKSLTESLQEFVRGDMLEGDNRYLCGECQEKRDTLKRTCIKTPPPSLVVHLKRFDYDWETNREIKFNNYFEFPFTLDLEPYTADGIASREKGLGPAPSQVYELTGIIVHQGQASAGHYYAFVKTKRSSLQTVPSKATPTIPEVEEEIEEMETTETTPTTTTTSSQWLKFNDTYVEEVTLTDSSLETECFGGTVRSNTADTTVHSAYPESRVRHWNAYMLFYESMTTTTNKIETQKERNSPVPISPTLTTTAASSQDNLSQLQELVTKGDKRGVFNDSIPSDIQRSVNAENLQFMKDRDVYCKEYFYFIRRLVFCNNVMLPVSEESDVYSKVMIELASMFLMFTYFRTYKELRSTHTFWVRGLKTLFTNSEPACQWFVDYISSTDNTIKPYLLECTSKEVRQDFSEILGHALQSYCTYKGEIAKDSPVDKIITSLLNLLDTQVIESWKTSAEYFHLLKLYATHPQGCRHLLENDVFVTLVQFLLGPLLSMKEGEELPQKRWSSLQVKEFSAIHSTLSLLVRNTNLSPFETETDERDVSSINPYMIPSNFDNLYNPSEGMHQLLFNLELSRAFIRECTQILRDCDAMTTDAIATMICYCCWGNQSFSACVIEEMQVHIHAVPPNELKSYFKALTEVLLIEDTLQEKRIHFTLEGGKYKPQISIFKTIQSSSESKRIYQGIKFLVGLANRCVVARDLMMAQSEQLQHAVSWLRRKINDYSWSHSSAYTFSNESSTSKIFQRTISAQDTLDEANALLNELEARDSSRQLTTASTSTTNNSYSGVMTGQHPSSSSSDNIKRTQISSLSTTTQREDFDDENGGPRSDIEG